MRINKNLEYFSTYDPSKDSNPLTIKQLCDDIHEEKLTLPIFQTYIRWKLEKSIELLNFQLYGKAAVSPISINKIEKTEFAVPQITFIERALVDKESLLGKHSVNDGQQRLSCNYKAYINHEDFRSVVLDISKGKFIINGEKIRKSQIPVGILYNRDSKVFKDYLRANKHLQTFDITELLQSVRTKHMGYYYIVNYAKDLTEVEQKEWFEVLNLAGSRVTGVQVSLTEMLVKGVDYYSEYATVFMERLSDANMEHLFSQKTTEISIPLAMLNPAYEVLKSKSHSLNFSPIPSDVKASTICNLDDSEIRKLFAMTLNALDKVINFIEDNKMGIPSRIDYITYLVGAFVFIGDKALSDGQVSYFREWYDEVVFDNLGNSERRKLFEDIIS